MHLDHTIALHKDKHIKCILYAQSYGSFLTASKTEPRIRAVRASGGRGGGTACVDEEARGPRPNAGVRGGRRGSWGGELGAADLRHGGRGGGGTTTLSAVVTGGGGSVTSSRTGGGSAGGRGPALGGGCLGGLGSAARKGGMTLGALAAFGSVMIG